MERIEPDAVGQLCRSMSQTARSHHLPRSSVPMSPSLPSARAASRVTPAMVSSTVRPKSVADMLSVRRSDVIGEVPGLLSVAIAIGTPWRRKFAIGGTCFSRST